ncbi:hypothetical protein GOP47_0024816 [Adiantum capillus-veneris]|uniref:Uncharacterized protein n=1 Tax=Adiantum capillus-veneris TaxID=13818 RepID=A0A9D4U2G6_ADICA|nr:hypothetical protein GOP47_0024816 [Adiantum capillus-veneris]
MFYKRGDSAAGGSAKECFSVSCAGWCCQEGSHQDSWLLNDRELTKPKKQIPPWLCLSKQCGWVLFYGLF